MNVVVWIVQILLAVAFGAAALTKLTQPKEKLRARMAWVDDYSENAIKTIAGLELLGAIGLVLPAATGILPWLTPLAAVGLALVMVGAAITHARRKETANIAVNAVLFVLAVFVAWARFGPYSL